MSQVSANGCRRGPFTLDWQEWYAKVNMDPILHPITKSSWVLESGAADIGADYVNGTKTTIYIANITEPPGGVLHLVNEIEVASTGERDCHDLYIEVN